MRAWQFTTAAGGLENTLKLNSSAVLPKRKPDQHLVQVLAASVNPVDYKLAEIPFFTRFILSKPATPAMDFAGRIVEPASGSSLEPGQLVFGQVATSLIGGALAEYAIAKKEGVTPLPEGVSPTIGASVAVVGLTAYQSISPYVKEGSNIFINGGSGGTGVYGIQIAKLRECHVTTSCSTGNVELCKSLGADEVIDYKKEDVLETLVKSGRK